jgi:hypothetical protein
MPSLAEILLEGGRLKSDALLRSAQITADAQRNKGLLWGAALSNAGQTIGQGIQHAQDEKAAEPLRAAQLIGQQQQNEMGGLQIQAAKDADWNNRQAIAKKQAIGNIMGSSLGEGGFYDLDKLTSVLQQYNMSPEDIKTQVDTASAINDHLHGFQQKQRDALGTVAAGIANSGYDPDVALNHARWAMRQNLITQQQFQEFTVNVARDPAHVKQLTDALLNQSSKEVQALVKQPKLVEHDPTKQLLDENAPGGVKVVLPAAPKEMTPYESATLAERTKHDRATEAQARAANPGVQAGSGAPIDASRPDPTTANKPDRVTGLTPNGLYQSAMTYALTRSIPAGPRGMAAKPKIDAIQNKASAMAAAAGVDLPLVQQDYAAASSSTKQLTSRYQFTSAAAQTANDNIAYALELSPSVNRSDIPAVNRFTQWLQHETGGGGQLPQLSQFELAIYTAAREYAKVTSNASQSVSELSQGAAKKADELINAAQQPEQFKAVTQGMQRDMNNVTAPLFKTLQNTNDVGPSLKKFLEATSPVSKPPTASPSGPAFQNPQNVQQAFEAMRGGQAPPPQVLSAGPGEHTFANGQVWQVSDDGKTAKRIK